MSKFLYNGIDLSEMIAIYSNEGGYYNEKLFTNISNLFSGFPNTSNRTINNNNFDKCLTKSIGYTTGTPASELSNQIPSKSFFYKSYLNANSININFNNAASNFTFPAIDYSNFKFNSTSNQNFTVPSIFNSMGVVLCGGGGGGGGTSVNNVNESQSGGSGAGGGFLYIANVDLNNEGRNWSLSVGGGGTGGMWISGNRLCAGGTQYDGGTGGDTRLTSNYTAHYAAANGGGGGSSYNNTAPNSVAGSSNSNIPGTTNFPSGVNNNGVNSTNGGAPGTLGGDCTYNSIGMSYSSNYIYLLSLNGSNTVCLNNSGGFPAGGDVNNQSGSTNGNENVYNINRSGIENVYGSGGGGSGGNNTHRCGGPGGPGAPGFAIIYYYL